MGKIKNNKLNKKKFQKDKKLQKILKNPFFLLKKFQVQPPVEYMRLPYVRNSAGPKNP